ncbi:ATP-binding protein [Ensifer adhaerens]|uniref:AAA family ATPase n=1 Tax=Ensifer adhaerens TaxID=106592 RepID=A0A9Q8YEV4_ENSAD|nr:AAA family ATPase [Ensifer adhaerens]USJ27628.1 AAA family ATPase [Ensifer adhaerens]
MNTILIFGISGVGKSWLCRQAAEVLPVRHVSGSQLIQAEKERATSQMVSTDALRTDRVVDNQWLLLEGFRNYRLQDSRSILFDGHNVIDTDNGLVEIPYEVISGLEPAAVVMVIDSPDTIVMRRASDPSRARPLRSVEALSTYQNLCLELAERHASALSVPTTAIKSGDVNSFISFVGPLV